MFMWKQTNVGLCIKRFIPFKPGLRLVQFHYVPTCPSTGEGEEPVVIVAGVKAERCRSCAEGTLSEGF